MDLRTERTKRSIEYAFLELRKQKPLEKITVKELAELAYINKATFYTHYHDIFDLADQLENAFFENTLAGIPDLECIITDPKKSVKNLSQTLSQKKELSDILFSGSRQNYYAQKLNIALRKIIDERYPEKSNDLTWNVVLTTLIQGCYQALSVYSDGSNTDELAQILGEINECLKNHFLADSI